MTYPNDRKHEEAERIWESTIAHDAARVKQDGATFIVEVHSAGFVVGLMKLGGTGLLALQYTLDKWVKYVASLRDSASRTEGDDTRHNIGLTCDRCAVARVVEKIESAIAEGWSEFTQHGVKGWLCPDCAKPQPASRTEGEKRLTCDEAHPECDVFHPGGHPSSGSKGHDKAAGYHICPEREICPTCGRSPAAGEAFPEAQSEASVSSAPKNSPAAPFSDAKVEELAREMRDEFERDHNTSWTTYAEMALRWFRSRPAPAAKMGAWNEGYKMGFKDACDGIRRIPPPPSAKGDAVREKIILLIEEAREFARNTGGHSPAMIFADEVEAALMKGEGD